MSNHVHLVAVPAKEDSLSVLFRRVHGRYAQYHNAHAGSHCPALERDSCVILGPVY